MSGLLDVAQKAYLTVRERATPKRTQSAQTTQSAQATQLAPTQTVRVHTKNALAVAFFKDGRRVVTASEDKTLRIWDVEKRALVGGPFEGHSDCVISVAVSPDDRRIASGGGDRTIIIWDVDSKQMVFKPLVKHRGRVRSVCFSPDGKRLASGAYDEKVMIWDAETGAVLSTLWCRSPVNCVAFSPNGLKLASSGAFGTIRIWSTDNAELLLKIDAHQDFVQSVVWSPDGQQLVSASHGKTIKFWDSLNGTQIGLPYTGHTSYIRSLAVSSDGCFIASASQDKTVRLWDTKSQQQIGQPLKHTVHVSCVAISPNGDLLAIGDNDGNLQLCKVKLGLKLYAEALSDAEKVIEINPSSYLGYELMHAALRTAQRYHAFEAFTTMLFKLDNTSDSQIRQLCQRYVSSSERCADQRIHGEYMVRRAFVFIGVRGPLQTELIKEAVAKYFSWVMLSHRWERKEPLLHDIQGRGIYDLDPVGTIVKLQMFCKVARGSGHRWAWSDTCCIDQNNNVELGASVNSMFIWYHHSALTIVYLSDVLPLSESGALANSIWNTRGWTVQEFLAPKIVLFYQADWSLYLDDRSRNHKESISIMSELERSTGINARALVAFRPGMRDAREKLQ
ncbi:WD40-repeat-containing domain protein [Suillus subaureus]|uniref:WD40-repeat-containing domain protein n=1 Tax=Suillus subaureus TaxID=48587 RepID=A0A9P7JH86_9AGAM|nr:WD40-repeat-containing domain protein [Suillus subaureus]KAG1821951.1 WD40-repeat-containing domain protein [Suillus subaureus]